MLLHRSGTLFEDMYWFDGASGVVLASVLDETAEGVVYNTIKFAAVLSTADITAVNRGFFISPIALKL